MKEVKYILAAVFGAVYSSLWWACFTIDSIQGLDKDGFPLRIPKLILLIILAIISAVSIGMTADYLTKNWHN